MNRLLIVSQCFQCKYNDMNVSSNTPYPFCNNVTRRFIQDGKDARSEGIPSWCPLPDENANMKGGNRGG